MKRFKKFVSIMLAAAMTLAMALPAMAAQNNSYVITVNTNAADKGTHTYEAYQVFSGDLGGGDGKLSNIDWGTGVNGDAILSALKAENSDLKNYFKECTTASQVADVLATAKDNDDNLVFGDSTIGSTTATDIFASIVGANLKAEAKTESKRDSAGKYTITVNQPGYYLVKDQDGSLSGQNDAAYTRLLLEVVGPQTVNVKSDVPTGKKEVFTSANSLSDSNSGAGIGEHVSYQISSNVPNFRGYDYYYFYADDTLSDGLDFDGPSSVKVTVNGVEKTQCVKDQAGQYGEGDYYVHVDAQNPRHFRIAFKDIMTLGEAAIGQPILITYSATINDAAKIGVSGNANTWTLKYSRDPNTSDEYGRNPENPTPGLPQNENSNVIGGTPEQKTLTYLTKLDLTKYANNQNTKLEGAEFTLTGTSYEVVMNKVTYYEVSENGTYWKLLSGNYTDVEPTGTVYKEIGVGNADTTTGYLKKTENGKDKYYIPTDKSEYNGKTIYKLSNGTASQYEDVNTKYVKKTANVPERIAKEVSIQKTTGADGFIDFVGLGEGEYVLTETVTPAGYNTIKPIKFTITFNAPEKVESDDTPCSWTFTQITNDGQYLSEQVFSGETVNIASAAMGVINKSGSTLPSTGGIGTTIFYIIGGILVVGAAILLVTKKRMSKEA